MVCDSFKDIQGVVVLSLEPTSGLSLDKNVTHPELVALCSKRASIVEARAQEKAGESDSVQDG